MTEGTYIYPPRFGQIAREMGFITPDNLDKALYEQISNDPCQRLRPRRLIGEILFENRWITSGQIKTVVDLLLRSRP